MSTNQATFDPTISTQGFLVTLDTVTGHVYPTPPTNPEIPSSPAEASSSYWSYLNPLSYSPLKAAGAVAGYAGSAIAGTANAVATVADVAINYGKFVVSDIKDGAICVATDTAAIAKPLAVEYVIKPAIAKAKKLAADPEVQALVVEHVIKPAFEKAKELAADQEVQATALHYAEEYGTLLLTKAGELAKDEQFQEMVALYAKKYGAQLLTKAGELAKDPQFQEMVKSYAKEYGAQLFEKLGDLAQNPEIQKFATETLVDYGAQLIVEISKLKGQIKEGVTKEGTDPAIQEKVDWLLKMFNPAACDVLIPMLIKAEELEAAQQKISLEQLRKNKAEEFGNYFTPEKLFPSKKSLNDAINDIIDKKEQEHVIGRMINRPSRFCRDHIYLDNLKSKLEKLTADSQNISHLGVVINEKIAKIIEALSEIDDKSTEDDVLKKLGIKSTFKDYTKEANDRIEENIKRLVVDKPNDPVWSLNIFKVIFRIVKMIWNAVRSTILTAFLRVYIGTSHLPDKLLAKFTPQIQSKIFEYLKINGEIEKYNKFGNLIGKVMMDTVLQEFADTSTKILEAEADKKPLKRKFESDDAANAALNTSIGGIIAALKKMAEKNKDVVPAIALASNVSAKLAQAYLTAPVGEKNPVQVIYDTAMPKWTEWLKA